MTSSYKGPSHHDDDAQRSSALQPADLIEKLGTFSSNLSRLRIARKKIATLPKKERKAERKQNDDALIGACTSLVYFLRDETQRLPSAGWGDKALDDETTIASVREAVELALVQSIRAASEAGDFILLQKLVHNAVDYATALNKTLLSPRIFGEAIASLSQTKASVSKVKALWNYFLYDVAGRNAAVLSAPPAAYELNAMLSGLRGREKAAAALKAYWQVAEGGLNEEGGVKIEGDAYTASILFGILSDSISNGASTVTDQYNDEEGYASPCRQWNEAMQLLETFSPRQLNNFAYAALLKVNERATEENRHSSARHDGVRCAMAVLERMKKDGISPDVVTCSTLLATFDKGRNWKAAVTLLNAMRTASPSAKKWSLPSPNTYTYSLVIAACARCNQGELALSLLDQMAEEVTGEDGVDAPNTWVYNAALLACVESASKPDKSGTHLVTAFDILEKMESGSEGGSNAPPDTVSYNTALSTLDESSFAATKEDLQCSDRLANREGILDVVMDVLSSMEARGVPRDAITYYNAIAASSSEDALAILQKALSDAELVSSNDAWQRLKGRASAGTIFVANAALSAAAKSGDVEAVVTVLSLLSDNNTKLNAESIKHIIRTLGKMGDCEAILALLICLRGQSFANYLLKERYDLDVLANLADKSIPMIEEEIYSAAITSCLKHDELGVADQILLSMKKNGLALNQRSLKEIIAEYCRMAMSSSKEEFKAARLAKKLGLESNGSQYGIVEPIYITSRARAKAALAMLKAVEKPLPPSLLSPVAKACCAAGLWQDARSIVRRMHRAAIHELRAKDGARIRGKFLGELPRLHRSLLKFCAKGGNITPALNFADDIQFLASQIRQHGKSLRATTTKAEEKEQPEPISLSSRLLMDIPTPDSVPESDFSDAGALSTILERPIGLTGQDWKLILIAASRGGHWKVCVGTLPFLRPYVKETHPMYARESISSPLGSSGHARPTMERLNRKYERIARALTAAILCFEARSQYAWAIRAIDDWIEWSGRRPRKEAVASACRVLAKRYRGQEVISLVSKVMSIPPHDTSYEAEADDDASDYTYEKAVYTESINALHKSGLFEEADQLYAEGVANGHLPWAVMPGSDEKQLRLDLHGMSAAVAHAAVRVSLQKEIVGPQQSSPSMRDVLIVTGRGRRSGERFRPILRPEVQRMLTEEFYPPLGSSSIPGNMGALSISSDDISSWVNHQQQQKGKRLLFVADVLRDISSGNRIEKALRSSGSRLERALRKKLESEGVDDVEGDGQ
ncbi:hypothetical protein ACHAXT_005362 [Thalassiosira profunda]